MKLMDYFKEHLLAFCIRTCVILFIMVLLLLLKISYYGVSFIIGLLICSEGIIFIHDYLRRRQFYNLVKHQCDNIEKKYLLSELIEKPSFYEGIFLYDLFRETSKSMNDYIGIYKRSAKAYREYIETWVHEVKTPIAASQLILINHPSESSENLSEELSKIDGFIEQALFYSRSNYVEKDYLIQQTCLGEMVRGIVKKHSKLLIESKIAISLEEMELTVYTDHKWIEFILGQIISNAVKYRSEEPKLSFSTQVLDNSIILEIKDNGIGMSKQDVARAFEKGFTGQNGRRFSKSTGMGLYLCDKLCDKLGLKLGLTSIEGEGTSVTITFPKSKMHLLEDVVK